jgi:hypothetical protein
LDNQNGNIKKVGEHRYELDTNITDAMGIGGLTGTYNWTVAIVQINPSYKDLGRQAEAGTLRFDAGQDDGNGGNGNNYGGSVAIE